ncbi:MAG: type I restriction enzyme HsdR N-terminal domain-containing protein [Paludibacteraceae bacterium]|nr:type I restriction enzyme HsdR N-terminal domain-containing protein [Paludibacteraceae bacterium]
MVNIFCPFRRKYVAATPEEHVRQTFLHALVEQFGYPQSLIGVEVPIAVGAGVEKRCDAVVYSRNLKPLMLIEFKAPEVPITQTTLDQAAVYNTTVHAPYLILANGKKTVVAHIDEQTADKPSSEQTKQIQFLNHIPSWNQLSL